jgi:hypothetical protein
MQRRFRSLGKVVLWLVVKRQIVPGTPEKTDSRRPADRRIAVLDPIAHEAQVEFRLQVPVEVVLGNQRVQGDQDRTIQRTFFRWSKHRRRLPFVGRVERRDKS